MQQFPLKDFPYDSFEKFVLDNAGQIVKKLDATITTQAMGLKLLPRHGDIGFFNLTKFENWNGSIKSVAYSTV